MSKPKLQEPEFEADPLAIADTPSTDVADILAKHVEYTDAGIKIIGELLYPEWQKAMEFFMALRSRSSWILGDCINYGEHKYGEKYSQAIDESGKSESRLQTIASVCSRFSHERRNPRLAFGLHEAAAYLRPQDADRLLKEAELKRWSQSDMRAEVAKVNELNGVTPKKTKKTGTAAKVAASGKEPQQGELAPQPSPIAPATIHGLFWNGYRLAITDKSIFQGTEIISEDESTRAAHHHGFADIATLRNWLEQNGFTNPNEKPPAPAESTPPAAPAPAQQAPEPAPVTPQPTAAPSPTAPITDPTAIMEQSVALERCEAARNRFAEAVRDVDWKAVKPLARKKWLVEMEFADDLIDLLAAANQGAQK